MVMTRSDSYTQGFSLRDSDDRHIHDVLAPDVHQVELRGNYQDIEVIVASLRVLAAEAQKMEAMGVSSLLSRERVEAVLAAIATPQFTDVLVEAP